MLRILNIETTTEVCSVAIAIDGKTIAIQESQSPNSHTEMLTLLIQACVHDAGITLNQLDAIAVSDGPGSYTSLRIGAATVKSICYALNKPLITVDSLSILAHGIPIGLLKSNDVIISMIDARRNEVYACVFDAHYQKVSAIMPLILDDNPFTTYFDTGHIYICGNGASKYYNQYADSKTSIQHLSTSARYMEGVTLTLYEQSKFEDVAYFTPDYIKPPNITKSTKRLF